MRWHHLISLFVAASLLAAGLVGCSLIDEDVKGCTNQIRLTYQLQLDPEIIQEMEDELDLHADEDIRAMLKGYVDGVFTNYARDVDLFFYETEDPKSCLRSLSEVMNSSSNTYALSMPVRSYLHTSMTNVRYSEAVQIVGSEHYPDCRLEHMQQGDYYTPQRSGLFTTRRRLDVGEKANQRFRLRLGMANSATALVLDTGKATHVTSIRVEVEGMATSFNIADSTYVYDDKAVFSTEEFSIGYKHCYASVHFPSKDVVLPPEPDADTQELRTNAVDFIDEDPSGDADGKPWRWKVYATLDDGTITLSILSMGTPVRAGQLKIRNAFVWDNGEVRPNEVDMSVVVQTKWRPGLDIVVPLK